MAKPYFDKSKLYTLYGVSYNKESRSYRKIIPHGEGMRCVYITANLFGATFRYVKSTREWSGTKYIFELLEDKDPFCSGDRILCHWSDMTEHLISSSASVVSSPHLPNI